MRWQLAALSVVVACGCGYSAKPSISSSGTGPGGAAGTGATVGGLKDWSQARALIAAGHVPDPSTITAEGVFSEHDFAVEGPPCTQLFCARPAAATHRLLSTNSDELFVHVGMASNLSPTWARPPADIVVAVDKGGSMLIDLPQTFETIGTLIDSLRPEDRFGVVVFDDDATVLVPLGNVADKGALKERFRAVQAAGSSGAVVMGASKAYEELDAHRQAGRVSRMMLFACDLPPTTSPSFDELVRTNAEKGTGASFFGILLSGDYRSASYFASLHGGNAYFLGSFADMSTVFARDVDFMLTPLAYDLHLAIAASGAHVERVWGIPDGKQTLDSATVFPSRAHGAIVLQLSGVQDPGALASALSLDFSYRPTLGEAPVDASSPIVSETRGGVRKAVAVVNLSDGLFSALTAWQSGQRAAAKTIATTTRASIDADAREMNDAELKADVGVLDQLIANMR